MKKKLTIKKEKVTSLSTNDMTGINGGKLNAAITDGSSRHDFTCGWCTSWSLCSRANSCDC